MKNSTARIALLTPLPPSEYMGGVEIFSTQLDWALGGVEIIADAFPRRRSSSWNLSRVGMEQPYQAYRVARSFLSIHRERPFDLVISNGLCGWPLWFWDLDVPMVQVYHITLAGLARQALDTRGDRITTGKVSAFFDRLAGRGKLIVAVSHIVLGELERYYGLSGQVIPNGVDTRLFTRGDGLHARKGLGLPEDTAIGLFVGRAEYAKGFDLLLEVAASMQDMLFVVVGRCPQEEGNIRVLENVRHSEMPLVYSAADFFFLPSRYEGFNLSILEALACDLPIVVSDAAYPFQEEPSRYGQVVSRLRAPDFERAIREVLQPGSSYAPRNMVAEACSLDLFRDSWRRVVEVQVEGRM